MAPTTRSPTCSSGSRRSTPKVALRNIADGMLRLDPSSPTDLVRLELDPIAHRFAVGKPDPADRRRGLASSLGAQPGNR